jgi:F0F1-type ATP synthase membrane subunit c/vacuolar-type H+-ATPase subunit K
MIIEGKTFMIALKQLRETSKNSIIKALKDSVDTNLIVIILEDSAALLGLVIAFVHYYLYITQYLMQSVVLVLD